MKKFRRIIATVISAMMMLAMSVTAFAAEGEKTSDSCIAIKGIEQDATVTFYQVAKVNSEDNKLEVNDWAKDAYKLENDNSSRNVQTREMTGAEVEALKGAVKNATPYTGAKLEGSNKNETQFTGFVPGVYYITAAGKDAFYSPMIAINFKADAKGNYVLNGTCINAKRTNNDLTKTAGDQFVYAGQVVNFTLTKTLPAYASKFVIYDYTTNLSSLDGVKATVELERKNQEFTFASAATEDNANRFALDLTSLVFDGKNFINTNAGKTITITYSATVTSAEGYKNEASFKVNDNDETDTVVVTGFEGGITLKKVEDGTDKTLEGAKFTLTKQDATSPLTFTQNEAGEYIFDAASKNTELVTDKNGLIVVKGLDEGVYKFTETEAPGGYSINTNISAVEIKATDNNDQNVMEEIEVEDSTLIKLPFTGGMGTTLFTVLGVAIMAIASALFFGTKKRA